jgi:Tol biopolymer transport system component
MALAPGSLIGHYRIVSLLGIGGMGEVYRAHDPKLGRDVALKILPAVFAADPDRLHRFDREARLLASLSHPHIGTIYGLEDAEGVRALVLELIEGDTLAERIAASNGPGLPLTDALVIARQIGHALEAAHERGIVHRDLKPANVKITPAGVVKVLDFGLAKAGSDHARELTHSPTLTIGRTGEGILLGTAAYMSPEQARGKVVDKRADLWAFGCVLYEMLTGRQVFAGETTSDMIVSILERVPDWQRLPHAAPTPVRRLLRRCLDKDLSRRLRDAGDACLEIEDAIAGVGDPGGAAIASMTTRRQVDFQRLTDSYGMKESPAVSPDGKMVAFVAFVGGRRQIWIRLLAGGVLLQVTRDDVDHEQPRWTPDSSTLIYYTPAAVRGEEGTIWEIGALGGPPRRVTAATGGGDVSHDGRRIAVFQAAGNQIALVSVTRDGSRTDRVVLLPSGHTYLLPRWAPDDRSIAFEHPSDVGFDISLQVVSVADGARRDVAHAEWLRGFCWLSDGSGLVYSSSRGSTLLYPPIFNLRTVGRDGRGDRQLTFGDVSHVEPDARQPGKLLATQVRSRSDIWKVPAGGSAAENTRDLVRVTRQTGQVQTPSVSPAGAEVVYLSDNGGHGNLWVASTDGSSVRQITFEQDPAVVIGVPMWSPAGNLIVFIVTRGGQTGLWTIRPDGSSLRPLVARGWGACWSADGRWLYYRSTIGMRVEKIPIDGGDAVRVRDEVDVSHPAPAADGSFYFTKAVRWDIFGLWRGDFDVFRAQPEDGPPKTLARILGERVPVSPLLLQLFLSPDGRQLAVPLIDGATTNVWALPTDGRPMRPITDFGDRSILIVRSVSWSADSRHLFAAIAEVETDIVLFDGLIDDVS